MGFSSEGACHLGATALADVTQGTENSLKQSHLGRQREEGAPEPSAGAPGGVDASSAPGRLVMDRVPPDLASLSGSCVFERSALPPC